MPDHPVYVFIYSLVYIVLLVAIYVKAIATFGVLGFLLGWIPAHLIASLVAAIWPLFLFLIIGAIFFIPFILSLD